MTAVGPSSLRPDSGFEEPPSENGRLTWAQRWHRVRLVPLILLVIAALIAVVTGIVTERETAEQFVPPAAAPAEDVESPGAAPEPVADVCAPPVEELPAGSPWTGEAREASDAIFTAEMAKLDEPYVVVPGNDNWRFWGDGQANNFSQALGRSFLNDEESEAWATYFRDLDAQLLERDVDLVIQVVPADWSVYPEALPDWAEPLRGPTTLDYLLAANPDLPIMDMRQPLRDAAKKGAVYAPGSSHWSPFGAAIGWQQLAACLAATDAKYAGLGPLDFTDVQPVPVEKAGPEPDLGDAPLAWVQPVLETPPASMQLTKNDGITTETTTAVKLDMFDLPAVTVTPDAQTQLSALILRDSQGNDIGPAWQTGFGTTHQLAHNLGTVDPPVDVVAEVDELSPDVVIFEVTERYLNWIPTLPE